MRIHSIGTWLSLVIVAAVAAAVVFSFAMNEAADDARQLVRIASSQPLEHPRTAVGQWLSARMAADVSSSDADAMATRAGDLDHRADRTRELAAAAALGGLVLMLATARPEERAAPARQEAARPVASTTSNGTV